jgi:hypothetical protein
MVEQIVDVTTDATVEFVQDTIRLSIGDPRNYDPHRPRRYLKP